MSKEIVPHTAPKQRSLGRIIRNLLPRRNRQLYRIEISRNAADVLAGDMVVSFNLGNNWRSGDESGEIIEAEQDIVDFIVEGAGENGCGGGIKIEKID